MPTTKTSVVSLSAKRERRTFDPNVPNPSSFLIEQSSQGTVTSSVTKGDGAKDWKRLIREGRYAGTPMVGDRFYFHAPQDGFAGYTLVTVNFGVVSKQRWEWRGQLDWPYNGPVDPSSWEVTSVRNRARMGFIRKASAALTSLKSEVCLGEMGQTLRLLNGATRDLFHGIKGFFAREPSRLFRARTLRDWERAVSARWLEFQYGVKPTISDINGALKGLSRMRDFRPPTQSVSFRAYDEWVYDVNKYSDNYFQLNLANVLTRMNEFGVRYYGKVAIPNNGLNSINTEFGLTFSEFVPTLWELIPYSFLVDYVSNIGDIIEALAFNRASLLWTATGELRGSRIKSDLKITIGSSVGANQYITDRTTNTGTPVTWWRRQINRQAGISAGLIPEIQFEIPGTSTKWLNILALGHQRTLLQKAVKTRFG